MSHSHMNNPNRLYFGNLGFDKVDDDVREIFSSCGEILDIHIIRDKFTKRSQGYGFITFKDAEGKKEGLTMNGKEFFGRVIKVNFESKNAASKEKKRLFVKNIPADKTEDDVKALFAQHGNVAEFFFIKDRATGQSKGFGFLDFETAEEAKGALVLNGSSEFGTSLIVKLAEEKPQQPRGFGGRGRGRGGYGGYGGRGGYGGGYGGGWGANGGGWNQGYNGGYQPYNQGGWGQQQQGGGYGGGNWQQQGGQQNWQQGQQNGGGQWGQPQGQNSYYS